MATTDRDMRTAALVAVTLVSLLFIVMIGGNVAWVYVLLLPAALLLGFVTQRRLRNLVRAQMWRGNERQGLLVDSIRGAESIRAHQTTSRRGCHKAAPPFVYSTSMSIGLS